MILELCGMVGLIRGNKLMAEMLTEIARLRYSAHRPKLYSPLYFSSTNLYSSSTIRTEPTNKTAFKHETSTALLIGGIQPRSYHAVLRLLVLTFDTSEPRGKVRRSESGSSFCSSAVRRKARAR